MFLLLFRTGFLELLFFSLFSGSLFSTGML